LRIVELVDESAIGIINEAVYSCNGLFGPLNCPS